MAAAVYASDLTDIYAGAGSTTGWSALGGGAAGLAAETDYYIQGTGCTSKAAFANSTRGMIYNGGAGITIPTDGAVLLWQTHQTANSLDTQANGGWQTLIGSSTTAYKQYYVAGSDTIVYDDRWRCIPINPTVTESATTGSPTATVQYYGILNKMVGGPTKGAPQASDAIRYGRVRYDYTNGDEANGYATFSGGATFNDAEARRYGQIQLSKGTYFMQGLHSLGTASTAVDFRDSNKSINIINTEFVTANFNTIEVLNAASVVRMSAISFTGLGTVSKGRWLTTANADVEIVGCSFTDMDTFVYLSNTTLEGCTWRRCGQITLGGATLSGGLITNSTAAVSLACGSSLSGLSDTSFVSDGSNHAIEITGGTTHTLNGISFTGYASSNGSTGNEAVYVNIASGDVTFYADSTFSYRTAGANVTIIAGSVTTTVTVTTEAGAAISGAAVALYAANGTGDLPYKDTVTIANSGTTATVTHTAHGMITGDKVLIEGASHAANRGVYSITYISANSYSYTMATAPGSNPTGTITSTWTALFGTTDGNGQISMSRVFSVDQPVSGWARKSTSAPYYKTGPVSGSIDSGSGVSLSALLLSDE